MADGGNLTSRLERIFVPACIGHTAWTLSAGTPLFHVILVVCHFETDPHMRVSPIKLRHGTLHRGEIGHVVPMPRVMREGWSGNDEQADRQDDECPQPEFHCVTSSQPLASFDALFMRRVSRAQTKNQRSEADHRADRLENSLHDA